MRPGKLLPLAVLALAAAPLVASTRLTYDVRGKAVPVAWPQSSFPLKFTVDRKLAESKPDAMTLLNGAAGEWSSVAEANLTFASMTVEDIRASASDHKNSISMAEDLFANQKALAFTTPVHDDAGNLVDTDIQIDVSIPSSKYNLQQLVAHELGHALGLDHSAVISATMYPWVAPNVATPLDSDDRNGIAAIYPRLERVGGAALAGKVMGDSGAVFAAQVVAVNDRGEPVATALTDQNGEFMLRGVAAGDYRIYAEPLDGPVAVGNLTGVWREADTKAFPTRFATDGQSVHADDGKITGNITVTAQGAATLNPRTVGVCAVGSGNLSLNSSPVTIRPGTFDISVGGDGFTSGMTTFEVMNPAFHRSGQFSYGMNYVTATYTVDPGALGGSAVILVHNGNDVAALTGALRIDGPRPGGGGRVRAVGR
jgi:hypothetical protein